MGWLGASDDPNMGFRVTKPLFAANRCAQRRAKPASDQRGQLLAIPSYRRSGQTAGGAFNKNEYHDPGRLETQGIRPDRSCGNQKRITWFSITSSNLNRDVVKYYIMCRLFAKLSNLNILMFDTTLNNKYAAFIQQEEI
jgi:hypothetical protein